MTELGIWLWDGTATAGERGVHLVSRKREAEDREKRQRLLDAALDAFPLHPSQSHLSGYQIYQDLLADREGPPHATLQGMITAHLAKGMRKWRRVLDEGLRARGHSLVRWHALFELSLKKPDETLTSLAGRIGVMSAGLVGLIDELEKEGLIVRAVDESDRRSKLISLTPAGEAAVSEMYDYTAELRQSALKGFTETEMRLLLDAAQRLSGNLDAMD